MITQKIKHKDKKLIRNDHPINSFIEGGSIENIFKNYSTNSSLPSFIAY